MKNHTKFWQRGSNATNARKYFLEDEGGKEYEVGIESMAINM